MNDDYEWNIIMDEKYWWNIIMDEKYRWMETKMDEKPKWKNKINGHKIKMDEQNLFTTKNYVPM